MPNQRRDPSVELTKRVAGLLNGCLGADPFRFGAAPAWSPPLLGLYTGLAYALFFCALPWAFVEPEHYLFRLSVYGSLYAAWATTIARYTSAKVLGIITDRIIPELSPGTADKISDDLARRFRERRIVFVSWSAAILGTAAAGWAISRDVPNVPLQVGWLCVGWLLLFVTAARTTDVARFYYVFAEHLEEEGNIYVLDPARSALVRGIASVGHNILLFWVGITVSVAMLIPFAAIGPRSSFYALLPGSSTFALIVVPTTSFFSILFGTFVFIHSERAIRKAVDKVSHLTLRSTELEIAGLFARRAKLNESEWKRMSELASLHSNLSSAGSYRGFLISGLSLLVPFTGPVVAFLLERFYPGP